MKNYFRIDSTPTREEFDESLQWLLKLSIDTFKYNVRRHRNVCRAYAVALEANLRDMEAAKLRAKIREYESLEQVTFLNDEQEAGQTAKRARLAELEG